MANSFIKAEQIVRTALGLLEREIVLPRLVWRDAGGDFKGAKNDTISIRLPAYATHRTRTLRAGTGITMDELDETKVDVTLDTDVYKAVPITDEELTLDIADFGFQVLGPVVRAVARGVEEELADTITGATYETILEFNESDPYDTIVDARTNLNDASVPQSGRFLAVGSSIEAAILKSDRFVRFDSIGDGSAADALRESQIGRIAGFTVVSVPALPPAEAYAAHQTAYVLSTRAPVVPEGATFGTSETFAGLAMRILRDYDFANVRDRLLADVFMGTNVVTDEGQFDENGKWVPGAADADSANVATLVRAVKISDEASA